jgi:uncharacterized protein YkwD
MLRLLIVVLIVILAISAAVLYAEINGDADPVELIISINDFRTTNGLQPLTPHPLVMRTAQNISESAAQIGSLEIDEPALMRQLKVDDYVPVSYHILKWQGFNANEFDSLRQQGYDQILLETNMNQIGIGAAQRGQLVYYTLILTQFSACDPANQEMVASVQQRQAQEVLRLTNDARTQRGLNRLTLDSRLSDAARWYSSDMKRHGYPTHRPGGEAHIGTDGSNVGDRIRRTGYHYISARENILMRENLDAVEAFEMWWNSPSHQANILANDITQMGLAFTCNPVNGEFYYTQVFANPVDELSDQTIINAVISTVNDLRRSNNRALLTFNTRLAGVAEAESQYVVQNKAFRRNVWDEVKNTGYTYREIQAATASGTSLEGITSRLRENSREMLLSANKSDIGVGVSRTTEGFYTVVILLAESR